MTFPIHWDSPHPKSAEVPVTVQRHQRKTAQAQRLEDAYAIVNARERYMCQASGRQLYSGHPEAEFRREHHHIKARRVKPEGREDPNNIVLVSALAHDLITKGWLLVEGEHAPTVRFRWAAFVKPGQKPFRLRKRRAEPV